MAAGLVFLAQAPPGEALAVHLKQMEVAAVPVEALVATVVVEALVPLAKVIMVATLLLGHVVVVAEVVALALPVRMVYLATAVQQRLVELVVGQERIVTPRGLRQLVLALADIMLAVAVALGKLADQHPEEQGVADMVATKTKAGPVVELLILVAAEAVDIMAAQLVAVGPVSLSLDTHSLKNYVPFR